MEIAIFNEITTEDLLVELEVEAKKYDGLYCDMENAEERKYVKDKASHIASLLKQLERARIDKSKNYKLQVEAEAVRIKDRLVTANVPFQVLIDEHKAERARILAIKKASDESKARALQLPIDHEEALQLNELFDFKVAQAKIEQEARDQKIRDEALVEAKANEQRLIEQAAQDKVNAENKAAEDKARAIEQTKQAETKRIADVEQARLDERARQAAIIEAELDAQDKREANKAHLASVNNSILDCLVFNGIDKESAKIMIRLAAKGELPNVRINY